LAKVKKAVAKPPKETTVTEIRFADYVGKKLKDIGHDESGLLTFFFDNGYSIKVEGNFNIIKEKNE